MNYVIVADGEFPVHTVPLEVLKKASTVVSCDGATEKLVAAGCIPDFIVGDLDSLPAALRRRFSDRLHHVASQESNDLTKAVDFCLQRGAKRIAIVGAGGLREDHTIANISLLADYAEKCDVEMITNYGTFVAISRTTTLQSVAGQQVSIFSLTPAVPLTSSGLKYPLTAHRLDSWWKGSLNEALGATFTLEFEEGKILVFRAF